MKISKKTDILQFASVDGWKTSWQDIEDLVTQVYYILESKRVEKTKLSQTQLEKMPLLAPFERKSTSVIDFESRIGCPSFKIFFRIFYGQPS